MLSSSVCYSAVLVLVLVAVILVDHTFQLLRDTSTSKKTPFSLSKVQLAFWFILIISAFSTVILCVKGHEMPAFSTSSLIVLGLSAGTMTAGRLIDIGDQRDDPISRMQNTESEGFLLDIISDKNGISLHRLQCVVFNLIIGGLVLHETLMNLAAKGFVGIDHIIPDVSSTNLVLLGLSSGAYVACKTTENKAQAVPIMKPLTLGNTPAVIVPAKVGLVLTANLVDKPEKTEYTARNIFVKVGTVLTEENNSNA